MLENAGIACRRLIDEVSAAQALLRLRDGAIVDVGGGSTGVGVVEDGELVSLSDMPGGGHHLDLILSGALRLSIDVAEQRKRAGGREIASILRPGFERIVNSVGKQIAPQTVDESTSSEEPCACPTPRTSSADTSGFQRSAIRIPNSSRPLALQ